MSSLLRICGCLTRDKDEIRWTIHNFAECCKSSECVARAPYTTTPHGRSLSSFFLVPYEFRDGHLEFAFQILTADAINYELSISVAPSSNAKIKSAVFLEGINITASASLRTFAIRGSLARRLVHSRNQYTAVFAVRFLQSAPPAVLAVTPATEDELDDSSRTRKEDDDDDDSPSEEFDEAVPVDFRLTSDDEDEDEDEDGDSRRLSRIGDAHRAELRRLVECASSCRPDEQVAYLKRLHESSTRYGLRELRETTVRALCACVSPANAPELLVFADLRGIECLRLRALARATSFPELDAAMVQHLADSLSLENAVDLAMLAGIHQLEGLKARTSEFLVANVGDVVASAGLVPPKNVELETIIEVLRKLVLE